MKDNNKEIDFGIIENAEMNELESLSEKVTPVSGDDKKKILEMSKRKFNTRNNDTESYREDTVSGSEPYRPRTMWKIFASAAACIAVVGGIAGGAALLHRNGSPAATPETTTEAATIADTTDEPATEIISQNEVLFIKGNDIDGPVVLNGLNIKSARVNFLPNADGTDFEYAIGIELDYEGARKFEEATSELAGTGTPISIWVNGECVYAPTVNSAITNGNLIISGNFDINSATELADKLENSKCPYDGQIYSKDDYGQLFVDRMADLVKNNGRITDLYYCDYDINGDDVPELFIQYYTSDPEYPNAVCELYSLQGESYTDLGLKSQNIWVHHDNKDGIIITKTYTENNTYLVFRLNEDGGVTLIHEFRSVVENGEVSYTIDGVDCSEEEWAEELKKVKPDDVEWLDELAKKVDLKFDKNFEAN
ncbi:SecDF P1 head subdomain-containing protein [Ruminococcus flavefaciens]|uniref:SecDF P1 head subdomain domain-containing protein n=1 Tax=Ruminococcus flavefaciens TaxID=1265 RepID=A0A1M7LL88_RUMFL|nr:hypothetical protein [Ruminococcus flavefaciens]SHM78942.1 hypothetical protein SAMN04487860_11416 [Ruminococcus flavefaciens]